MRAQSSAAGIMVNDQGVRVAAAAYRWSYSHKTDMFTVADAEGRHVVSGPLQPIVVVASKTEPGKTSCVAGEAEPPQQKGDRILFSYRNVNGGAGLSFSMRFNESAFWLEPLTYESSAEEDVVSVHYFAAVKDQVRTPDLRSTYLTVPGICESPAISPVENQSVGLNQTVSLGHGSYSEGTFEQQWGLPVHYFCAMSMHAPGPGRRDTYSKGRSNTLVCGLADLPNGDLLMDLRDGRSSVWIDYRSDLWHHQRTPGKLALGSTWCWAFGSDDYQAITAYYSELLGAGIIRRKQNSAAKNAVVLAPEFCTWGTQVVRDKAKSKLNQAFLDGLYAEMKTNGMEAKIFSIDDKWEGRYGNLEHSSERLPHFEQLLDRIRAEGHYVGLWTAFMRCEEPTDLGLEVKHMLQQADGSPYKAVRGEYYILDFTHPEVERVLRERARQFVRRYKPALVKFDFGYELPAVRTAAPFDKSWAGERILKKGLDIVVGAMREENPDIAVMYYQLSPLFVDYFDLHSTDDLYLAAGDYDVEANRRIYFASVLTQLGVPVYGSSGYDWSSSPEIWFDSVVSGTIGSLNDLKGDEFGEAATPERIALYNGFAQTIRPGNLFTVVPYPAARDEASVRGTHGRSWARIEEGGVTMVAQRPPSFDEGDSLEPGPVDPRIDKLIVTTVPVVVASKTADSIARSGELAVVPCGEGKVSIRREQGRTASITTHCFGGAKVRTTAKVEGGRLVLRVSRSAAGVPVEWVQVRIV